MIAGFAARADEAIREDAASEIRTELVLDIARERRGIALAGVRQERLEVLANKGVQHRLGRTARPIGNCECRHGGFSRARAVPNLPP